jgi:hypothetical protein
VTVLAEAKRKQKQTKKGEGVNPGRMERRSNAHGKKRDSGDYSLSLSNPSRN